MNNKFLLRVISFLLLLIMMIPFISSCAVETDVKVKVDNVFKSEHLTVPDDFSPSGTILYTNDKIYMQGYEQTNYSTVIYSVNKDGTDGNYIDLLGDKTNAYIYSLKVTSDGNIMYLYNVYYYDEATGMGTDTYSIAVKDTDGNLLMDINLSEMLKSDEDSYFYVYNFHIDMNNNIYITSNNIVYVIDSQGNYLFNIVTGENTSINTLLSSKQGDTIVVYGDYSTDDYKILAKLIDFDKKDLGKDYNMGNLPSQYMYSIVTSTEDKYDFFYSDSNSIYGYNIESDTSSEIINWINSDIDSSYTNSFCIISSDELICAGYNYLNSKNELMLLERVPEEEVKEKYILTLATYYMEYDLRARVIEFNRNSLEYRIQVEDYSKYNIDYDSTGITRLNTDISTGKIPDILVINGYYNIAVSNYASKGVFADLNTLIDNDPDINRSDFFENILEAAEYNGKLYQIFPTFYIQTVIGKTKFFGGMDGWTLSDFNSFMASQPDGTLAFQDATRSSMLEKYCTMMVDDFIDYSTGKCDFDSEGFIQVLEFCKSLSDKYVWDDPDYDWDLYWAEYESAYAEDRVMLMEYYLSSFDYFWDTVKVNFGDDIKFIGMPTESKNGSAIQASMEFSISSNTKHPDGAWAFVRTFIMDDYLETITYNFPIKKSLVEKMADKAITPPNNNGDYYPEPVTEEIIGDSPVATEVELGQNIRYINNEPVDIGFITREYTDMIIDLIESIDHVIRYDSDMIEIIKEEAAEFFEDRKSAAEVAKIIQNRLQNYIDERR